MLGYIRFADRLSAWFGKTFGWLIILMTFGMAYEVMVRYAFNRPTPWAFAALGTAGLQCHQGFGVAHGAGDAVHRRHRQAPAQRTRQARQRRAGRGARQSTRA